MGSRKHRFVLFLIVYFAGFITAIYCLVPAPGSEANGPREKSFVYSALKSDEFAQSFSAGMNKWIDIGKDAACRAGKFIKHKLNEKRRDS